MSHHGGRLRGTAGPRGRSSADPPSGAGRMASRSCIRSFAFRPGFAMVGAGRVVVAERGRVENLTYGKAEAFQRLAPQFLSRSVAGVSSLPNRPDPVDHGVMSPEDRVVGRRRLPLHRAPDPTMNAVMEPRLQGFRKNIEVRLFDHFFDQLLIWETCRVVWLVRSDRLLAWRGSAMRRYRVSAKA